MNKSNIIITGEDFDYGFNELKAMEVDIFHYPMIYTLGIDINIQPNIYNYIIFTSKNGVKYFLKNVSTSINRDIKFICIGKKTAEALNKRLTHETSYRHIEEAFNKLYLKKNRRCRIRR